MRNRLDLHDELEALLGSRNVYFNRPESKKIEYPCIIYKRDRIDSYKANNRNYYNRVRYQITFIRRDPDSDVVMKMFNHFQFFEQETAQYIADNLYHDVFTLYY